MTLIDAIRTFWDEMRTFLDATYTFVLDREPLTCGGAAVDVAHAVGRLGCARDLVGGTSLHECGMRCLLLRYLAVVV